MRDLTRNPINSANNGIPPLLIQYWWIVAFLMVSFGTCCGSCVADLHADASKVMKSLGKNFNLTGGVLTHSSQINDIRPESSGRAFDAINVIDAAHFSVNSVKQDDSLDHLLLSAWKFKNKDLATAAYSVLEQLKKDEAEYCFIVIDNTCVTLVQRESGECKQQYEALKKKLKKNQR
jgi:hypothetical protein